MTVTTGKPALYGFPIFWFWALFQKRVVWTKFDIYVFIVCDHSREDW